MQSLLNSIIYLAIQMTSANIYDNKLIRLKYIRIYWN